MTRSDLTDLSATELAASIRRKRVSPVELVDAVLARINSSQASVNAFITVLYDAARAEAKAAEKAVMLGDDLGPLHGVPFSVKDLAYTAGVRTTMGSAIFENFVPSEDAVPVARLKHAGAILLGKTTTPEFGHKPLTDSPIFGVTRNPWDLSRTCGGSSGGAAAAIASGLGPLALGSDGGGSIRIPASCCGIVGLKATLGVVPHVHAPDLFGNNSFIGPMTRTIADARLVLDVIAGPIRTMPMPSPCRCVPAWQGQTSRACESAGSRRQETSLSPKPYPRQRPQFRCWPTWVRSSNRWRERTMLCLSSTSSLCCNRLLPHG